jgi:hypothetical protein
MNPIQNLFKIVSENTHNDTMDKRKSSVVGAVTFIIIGFWIIAPFGLGWYTYVIDVAKGVVGPLFIAIGVVIALCNCCKKYAS